MARAMKCDRCKKYFDFKEGDTDFVSFRPMYIENGIYHPHADIYDLCPECTKSLSVWFSDDYWNDES